MKQEFSASWASSRQIRKQRKYRYNAPLHTRHKFLSANLSKELRKKHGKRSIAVRKGDEVLIMRGKFAKQKGKVLDVNMKRERITLENVNRTKKDGTKVNVYFNPSKLQIINLNADDSRRMARPETVKKEEKPKEKNNAPKKN